MQNLDEMVEEIVEMGVFEIAIHINQMIVKTSKTVSKVNYKRLMKMNNNTYMKAINFTTDLTSENLEILRDISIKTGKYSQQALNDIKKARLQGKFKEKSKSSFSFTNDSAYDHWMDVVGYPPSSAQLAAYKKSLNKK